MEHKIDTLIIETVGFCNLKCIMCPTRNYTVGKTLMSDNVFEKVIQIIKEYDIRSIDMTGWGEPLLDPKLEERIHQIKELKSNISIGFITNASLFTEKRIKQVLEAEVNWINVSFDTASKETYEKIRVNSKYYKVIENLKLLSSLRDREKTKLIATMVVMKYNFHEMEDFVRLFYKLGFDSIIFKPVDVISSKNDLKLVIRKEKIYNKYLELQKMYGDKIEILEWDVSNNYPKDDCLARAASGTIFINCMGDVSPCCNLGHHVPRIIKKYRIFNSIIKDSFFSFGNLLLEDLNNILKSNRYKSFIRAFKNSCLPEPCRGCRLVSKELSKNIVPIL